MACKYCGLEPVPLTYFCAVCTEVNKESDEYEKDRKRYASDFDRGTALSLQSLASEKANKVSFAHLDYTKVCDDVPLNLPLLKALIPGEYHEVVQPFANTRLTSLCCGLNAFMTFINICGLRLGPLDTTRLVVALSIRDDENYMQTTACDLIVSFMKEKKVDAGLRISINGQMSNESLIGNANARRQFILAHANKHFTLHLKNI